MFTTRASQRVNKLAKNSMIVTALRISQIIVTLLVLIFVLITFPDIPTIDDKNDPTGTVRSYRFAQLPQFFAVMAAILGFVYSLLYCILVLALDYWTNDVLLERIADCILAIALAVCGFCVGTSSTCKVDEKLRLNCTNLRGSIGCLYVAAVVYLATFAYSMMTQEVPHPDDQENLVPRGNYGPGPASPAHPRAVASRSADNTLDLMPRGKFGSIAADGGKPSFARDESGGLV
ncbi:Aste57867_10158 [Aphanomyces stellatus]|uniref:Aste57867_10158 protein n=1 Tax=Aphanomyces stellatus TaxID=120398 RepID=A0A485KQM2_9STRA|nr:hypothetical protein As57867_010119 [Aphanomyces stellatus]VFT87034.1 Aste57867_10158 [Aphanomyces stellatus]